MFLCASPTLCRIDGWVDLLTLSKTAFVRFAVACRKHEATRLQAVLLIMAEDEWQRRSKARAKERGRKKQARVAVVRTVGRVKQLVNSCYSTHAPWESNA